MVKLLVLLLLTEMLLFNAMDITLGAFPLHATALGADPAGVGVLTFLWSFGLVIARPAAVRISRRHGLWALLGAAAVIMVAGPLLVALAPNPAWLGAARLLYAFGPSAWMVAMPLLITDAAPPHLRGVALGWYGAISAASLIYGPGFGIALFDRVGLWAPYWAAICAGLVSLGLTGAAWWVRAPEQPTVAAAEARRYRIDGQTVLGLAGVLLLGACFITLLGFLTLYAKERGLTPEWPFILMAVVATLSRLVAGRALDRLPLRAVATAGTGVLLLGLLALGWAPYGWLIYAGAALVGAGHAAAHTACLKLVIDRADEAGRPGAMAWFQTCNDGGMAAGGFLFGLVAAEAGYAMAYGAFALLALALLPIAARLQAPSSTTAPA